MSTSIPSGQHIVDKQHKTKIIASSSMAWKFLLALQSKFAQRKSRNTTTSTSAKPIHKCSFAPAAATVLTKTSFPKLCTVKEKFHPRGFPGTPLFKSSKSGPNVHHPTPDKQSSASTDNSQKSTSTHQPSISNKTDYKHDPASQELATEQSPDLKPKPLQTTRPKPLSPPLRLDTTIVSPSKICPEISPISHRLPSHDFHNDPSQNWSSLISPLSQVSSFIYTGRIHRSLSLERPSTPSALSTRTPRSILPMNPTITIVDEATPTPSHTHTASMSSTTSTSSWGSAFSPTHPVPLGHMPLPRTGEVYHSLTRDEVQREYDVLAREVMIQEATQERARLWRKKEREECWRQFRLFDWRGVGCVGLQIVPVSPMGRDM